MTYSEIPDTSFTWIINNFKEASNWDPHFVSPTFTTSRDPERVLILYLLVREEFTQHCDRCKSYEKDWKSRRETNVTKIRLSPSRKNRSIAEDVSPHLKCNSNTERKVVDIELRSTESMKEPLDFKIVLSIVNFAGTMFSRSLIISGNKKIYHFDNFIDFENLQEILKDENLEILVEIMYEESEKKENNFINFLNQDFLSDVELSIQGNKISAHKASD